MDIVAAVNGVIEALNKVSPLGLSAGLAYLIYVVVKGKTSTDLKIDTMRGNDLHELPEAVEILRRIEIKISEEFAYLRARLNGRDHN